MDHTGRIESPPAPAVRRLLFERTADAQIRDEFPYIVAVDEAHLVMLAECGIIDAARARRLLAEIAVLRESGFAPLVGRVPSRGVYLMYEDYLIEKLGPETAGVLQTGRSRNDLAATVFKLRVRRSYADLLREALRLQAVLLCRARRYAAVVMPAYTHGQPAMPSTFGHYLAAVAEALSRDLEGLESAVRGIHLSPLGAGAVAGSTLPIRTVRTARLLGFRAPVPNSIDAVASRDLALRILSACAIFHITLSRLAADLFQWSTAEFDFLSFPDGLCGSSSAMPQKRNPFLLEHILGRSAAAPAEFLRSAMAMHAMPFSNSIAVGTEAICNFWDTMRCARETALLMRLIVFGIRPNCEAMRRRAESGYTAATELANRLVLFAGLDFRTAHRTAGEIVLAAIRSQHAPLEEVARRLLATRGISFEPGPLDTPSLAASAAAGGGPAPASQERCIRMVHRDWTARVLRLARLRQSWARDDARRWDAVQALRAGPESAGAA
jgi:argininosuccinate lyase